MDLMIIELENIKRSLQSGKRVLGLDLGEKNIGLAVSDPALRVASPYDTIRQSKFTKILPILSSIINTCNIGALVFGWPLHMNGTISKKCQSTRQFALNLSYEGLDIPSAFFDERFSTVAINKILITEADMSREKRKLVVDKMAASYMLQGALDCIYTLDLKFQDDYKLQKRR